MQHFFCFFIHCPTNKKIDYKLDMLDTYVRNVQNCSFQQFTQKHWNDCCQISLSMEASQWSKSKKVFQRGDHPNFGHFPSETYVLMSKYQKLAKSVEGNWGFWINFDFKKFSHVFWGYLLNIKEMALPRLW